MANEDQATNRTGRGIRPGEGGGPERLLDPAVLARIDNLDLVARTVMQGFVGGAHPTARLGTSTDFAEYRGYVPGDDVRRVDWRVYGRTDRLFIKTFEADSNADFVVAVDGSASMDYAGPDPGQTATATAGRSGARRLSKFDYARMAAASLIHLGARQRDRLGFAALHEAVEAFVPPSARHRNRIVQTLQVQQAHGPGNLIESLRELLARLPRRAIVIVLSDLYGDPTELGTALQALRLRGHDVIVFHVLDPRERDFDLGAVDAIEDLESGERLPVRPAAARDGYVESMNEHIDALRRECARRDVDYSLVQTDWPLEMLLFTFLSQRARRRRR